MGNIAELRAGLSEQQRVAAAASRQQLLEDLNAQVEEKAARVAAAQATEAERAAAEGQDAAPLWRQAIQPSAMGQTAQRMVDEGAAAHACAGV